MTRLLPILAFVALSLGACGEPELRIAPIEDQQVYVGEFLRVPFEIRGAGGNDVALTYTGPALPFLGRWAFVVARPTGGEFQWSPTFDHEGEHRITVYAEAGNQQAAQEFEVAVIGAREATPVFMEPGPGDAFDLAVDPCIEVPVEANDRDSDDVALRVAYGLPAGATFDVEGSGRGVLRWCPTADQVSAAAQWVITFEATDGEHEPVLADFRLLLLGPQKDGCGGTPPTVTFTRPEDGGSLISRVGYDVEVRIEDDGALRDRPVLFYTDGRVEQRDQLDLHSLGFAPFRPLGDGLWTAHIPTFRLAEDESQTLSLVPFVMDDDDPTGTRCDRRAELRIRRFNAVGAVEAGILEDCERCLVSGDCQSGVCIRGADGGRCVPACEPDGPACEVGVCQEWSSMEGVVRYGCGDASLVCDGLDACVPDASEPNDGPDQATALSDRIEAATCERDDDWFVVAGGAAARVAVTLDRGDAAAGTVELHLTDASGRIVSVGALDAGSTTIRAEACVGEGAPLRARVFSPTLSRVPYSVAVTRTAEACACEDDAFEPDSDSAPRIVDGTATGVICGTDTDTFALEGGVDARATLALTIDGEGDLDLEVLGPDGHGVARSAGTGAMERVVVDLSEGTIGTYRVRISSFDGRSAAYTLSETFTPLAACTESTECALGERCDEGTCRRVPCDGNADCPHGSVCPLVDRENTARTCLDGCSSDADCAEGQRCKDFFEGRACWDEGTGETGATCERTSECAANAACVDWPEGHCAPAGCERGDDVCAAGTSCAVVDGRASCVETCWVSDTQCTRGGDYTCRELFAPDDELVYGCSPTTR